MTDMHAKKTTVRRRETIQIGKKTQGNKNRFNFFRAISQILVKQHKQQKQKLQTSTNITLKSVTLRKFFIFRFYFTKTTQINIFRKKVEPFSKQIQNFTKTTQKT